MNDEKNYLGGVSPTAVDAHPCSVPAPRLPHDDARAFLSRMYRLSIGRDRRARAAERLGVDLLVALKDNDLVVILADEVRAIR